MIPDEGGPGPALFACGPAPGLPRVRDQLRAWAMTHGADVTDRPFEEYLDPIEDMLTEDAHFKVYWPIK